MLHDEPHHRGISRALVRRHYLVAQFEQLDYVYFVFILSRVEIGVQPRKATTTSQQRDIVGNGLKGGQDRPNLATKGSNCFVRELYTYASSPALETQVSNSQSW